MSLVGLLRKGQGVVLGWDEAENARLALDRYVLEHGCDQRRQAETANPEEFDTTQ